MYTKKEQKEMKVVDFDQLGFESTMATLEGFIRAINNKPTESNDPLSLRAQNRNGIVNECFRTSCLKIGLTSSLELLKKVLNISPSRLLDIITDEVKKELDKQTGIHDAVKPSILKGYEPAMLEFISVINRMNQTYSFMTRPQPGRSNKIDQIENYISFENGLATVTDETKEQIREIFTTGLDSPDKQEIHALLTAAGEAITKLNERLLTLPKFYTPMSFDSEYLTNEGSTIIPRNDIIKYF